MSIAPSTNVRGWRRGRRNLRDCDDRVDEGGLLHSCQYCPAAIHHAISAPNGPVAVAKVRGRDMLPAPIIEPMTIACCFSLKTSSSLNRTTLWE